MFAQVFDESIEIGLRLFLFEIKRADQRAEELLSLDPSEEQRQEESSRLVEYEVSRRTKIE